MLRRRCCWFASLKGVAEARARQLDQPWPLGITPAPKHERRISSCFDASLPSEQAGSHDNTQLQAVTEQLHLLLESGNPREGRPTETSLLASEMEKVLCTQQPPLELNSLNREGQTLLPKTAVRIVTAELQGWSASGGIGSAYLELARALARAGHSV